MKCQRRQKPQKTEPAPKSKEEADCPISNMTYITGLSDIQCYTFIVKFITKRI